jgi:hypothetical protein
MGPLLLNGSPARTVRIVTPARGVWRADVDTDDTIAPAGPVTITIGAAVLVGTADPRATGRTGALSRVHVAGGGGGWDKPVRPQAYHNDAGVLSTEVYATTAAEVGETVTEIAPARLGADYVRTAGAASTVLDGLEWWVTPLGVTVVGPRPPAPLPPTVDVLSWDPRTRTAELACDELLQPGAVIVDPRFDGAMVVRDVEQVFSATGGRATAWCAAEGPVAERLPGTRAARALAALAADAAGVARLRVYRYRLITQALDGRCNLQLVAKDSGAPAFLSLVPVWAGIAGATLTLTPGTQVGVEFLDGDRTLPRVVAFDASPSPLAIALAARLMLATEHATTAEATAAVVDALIAALAALCGGVGGASGAAAFATALNALTDGTLRAPAVAALLGVAAGATLDATVKGAIDSALGGKAPDTNGTKPGLGCPGILVG